MAFYGLAPGFNIVGTLVEEEDEIVEVVDEGDAEGRIQKILEVVDEGDAEGRIQKINELHPLTEDVLALTLAGLFTDQDDLAAGKAIAVMRIVSDRLLGYAREVLNEWKTRRIEEWKAWKALRVEIGTKRKDIDDGIMVLEGLHKSLAWEKEDRELNTRAETPETSPHQEPRYFAFMSSHDLGAAIGKLTVTDVFYQARASRCPRLV